MHTGYRHKYTGSQRCANELPSIDENLLYETDWGRDLPANDPIAPTGSVVGALSFGRRLMLMVKFVTENHIFLSTAIEGSMWRHIMLALVNIDIQYYERIVACLSGCRVQPRTSADGHPMFHKIPDGEERTDRFCITAIITCGQNHTQTSRIATHSRPRETRKICTRPILSKQILYLALTR